MHRHRKKFDPERVAYLESEERRAILDPDEVLGHFEIGKGWTVLDVGCGPGVFSFPLAEMVGPSGRVYAIDTEPLMLKRLEERIAERRVANVVPLQSTEDSVPLPDSKADFALMSTVIHELEGSGTLREVGRVLKESGTLAVVDWKKVWETVGPPKWIRLDEDQAAEILREAGFEPGPPMSVGRSHYGFAARKPHSTK